jgi:RNA:NAD 2'-phosphotransferase (TPT1/KptA family)
VNDILKQPKVSKHNVTQTVVHRVVETNEKEQFRLEKKNELGRLRFI